MFAQVTDEDVERIVDKVIGGGSFSDPRDGVASIVQEIVNRCIQEDQQARLGALVTIGEDIKIPDTIRYDGPPPVQLSVL